MNFIRRWTSKNDLNKRLRWNGKKLEQQRLPFQIKSAEDTKPKSEDVFSDQLFSTVPEL